MPKNLVNIKAEIIQVTRKMILENGYEKLNIRNIAKQCGIATGTFYNYFRSKQAIVSSLLDADWEAFRKSMVADTDASQPLVAQLETVFENLKRITNDVHSIWVAGFPDDLDIGTRSKLQRIRKDLRTEFSRHMRGIIQGHVQTGQEEFTADFITRIFFSYAYEAGSQFEALRPILKKIFD